jgi:hypothetical protein
MEQVLYRVHVRILTTSNRFIPSFVRRSLEWSMLFSAICMTLSLIVLHTSYVRNSGVTDLNCIMGIMESTWNQGYYTEHFNSSPPWLSHDLVLITLRDIQDPLHIEQNLRSQLFNQTIPSLSYQCTSNESFRFTHSFEATSEELKKYTGKYNYFYSNHRGIIMLTQDPYQYIKPFTVFEIAISSEMTCFGDFYSKLLAYWTGTYDVILLNWLIKAFDGQGYLFNTLSKEVFNLNYAVDIPTTDALSATAADYNIHHHHMHSNSGHSQSSTSSSDSSSSTSSSDSRHPVMTFHHHHTMIGRRESYTNNANYLIVIWRIIKQYLIRPCIIFISSTLTHYLQSTMTTLNKENGSLSIIDQFFSTVLQDSMWESTIVQWIMIIYKYISFRLGVIFSTFFLFFISTTLINYILRETQERMVRFTFLFQYHITHRIPYIMLVATHVIGTLVFVPILMGIYFFLFEFFSDQLVSYFYGYYCS